MRDINPNSSKSAMEERTWKTSSRDQRIGFINRDAEISETISAPSLIAPMGEVLAPRGAKLELVDHNKRMRWADETSSTPRSAAGICVFDFLPVFGSNSAYFREGIRSIAINKWTEWRQIYSGVEAWQPGDAQAVEAQTMNLKMHIAHLWRTLRIIQSQSPSAESKFSTINAWVRACGWNISDATARAKYPEWHNKYNMIAAAFNKINWIKDFVPGSDRWMAMCSEIYKDTSADTEYCQAYLFRPRGYYSLTFTDTSLPTPSAYWKSLHTWTMNPDGNYYQQSTTDEAVAIQMFEAYMDKILSDVYALYYDSSVQSIVSTLLQVAKLTKDESLITHFDMPYLTMNEDPIPLVWDFATMLAISNSTICDIDLSKSIAIVNGIDGTFEQEIYVNTSDSDYYGVTIPKLLNLPCFTPTNADFANATQWTIVTDKLHGDDADILDPTSYATEILCRCSIYYYHHSQQADHQLEFAPTRYHQYVSLRDQGEAHGLPSVGMQEFAIQVGSNFAFKPIVYCVHWNSDDSIYEVENVIEQLEVNYIVGFDVLRNIHNVWSMNFWGFPSNPSRSGEVRLTTET